MRSTAQVMEWRDPFAIAKLEAYATGYLDAIHLKAPPQRTTPDYDAGHDHGMAHLASRVKSNQSLTPT